MISIWMLLKRESLKWNKVGVDLTRVQERRHGTRTPHTGSGFLVMWISLSAQPLENLLSRASDCAMKVATLGESISEFEVSKRLCANHCCLLESTRRCVELQSCKVTKGTCPTRARMLRGKFDHGSRRRSAVHNTTVAQLRTKKTTCTTST